MLLVLTHCFEIYLNKKSYFSVLLVLILKHNQSLIYMGNVNYFGHMKNLLQYVSPPSWKYIDRNQAFET